MKISRLDVLTACWHAAQHNSDYSNIGKIEHELAKYNALICKELGYAVDREKLTIALANVYNTKNFENKNLSKLFQISNVSLILDIIKIFCSIP